MSPQSPGLELHEGDLIGPYRILGPLGRGGMGVVYRAVHRETSALAAIKTVKGATADSIEGIRREIHALARIRHPGVVRIFDNGTLSGMPWYAMELLKGDPLSDWLKACRAGCISPPVPLSPLAPDSDSSPPPDPMEDEPSAIPIRRFLSLALKICRPLAYIHGEGIVHRDLKPGNIFVQPGDRPVLVDFGLTTLFTGGGARESLGARGESVGTVAYVAPEQGEGNLVDARADLYSLGCIIYEMLTGKPPFLGKSPGETLRKRYVETAVPPSFMVQGVDPAMDRLVLALLEREPEDRIGYAADVAARLSKLCGEEEPEDFSPKPYLYRPALAGRDEPLRQARRKLHGLFDEKGAIIAVGGESGVGKTRFALELMGLAFRMATCVLAGECTPDGRLTGSPLGVFSSPLRTILDRVREEHLVDEVLGPRGAMLESYFPFLAGAEATEESAPELSAKAGRRRVFEALAATLESFAEQVPSLLVLDDLQWADRMTIEFLDFLKRSGAVSRSSLLLLLTCRTDEMDPDLRSLLSDKEILAIELSRLDGPSIGTVIAGMLAMPKPPAELVDFLATRSEGNPFFIAEYLRVAVDEGLLARDAAGRWFVSTPDRIDELPLPAAVYDLVAHQLKRLPSAARSLLQTVSIFGRTIESDNLREAVRIEEGDYFDSLKLLMTRDLLDEPAPGRYRIGHDQVRLAAYESLPAEERTRRHRDAALLLERRARKGERQPAVIGRHWEAAEETVKAASCYLEAWRKASREYALQDAKRYAAKAAGLAEPGSRDHAYAEFACGEAFVRSGGKLSEASGRLNQALQEATAIQDLEIQAHCLKQLGAVGIGKGDLEGARASYQRSLALFAELKDKRYVGSVHADLGHLAAKEGNPEAAKRYLRQALDIHRSLGLARLEAMWLGDLASFSLDEGKLDEAEQGYREALEIAREAGEKWYEGALLANLGNLAGAKGFSTSSIDYYRSSRRLFERIGDRTRAALVAGNLGVAYLDEGRFEEAEESLSASLAGIRESERRWDEGRLLGNLGLLFHNQDRLAEAEPLYRESVAISRSAGNRPSVAKALCNLGSLLAETGELDEAEKALEESIAIHRDLGDVRFEAITLAELARLHLYSGSDTSLPEKLARKSAKILRAFGDPCQLIQTLAVLGHIHLAAGRSPAHLREEIEALLGELDSSDDGTVAAVVSQIDRAMQPGANLLFGIRKDDLPAAVLRRAEGTSSHECTHR